MMKKSIASYVFSWMRIYLPLSQESESALLSQALFCLSLVGSAASALWLALRDAGIWGEEFPGVLVNGIVILNGG